MHRQTDPIARLPLTSLSVATQGSARAKQATVRQQVTRELELRLQYWPEKLLVPENAHLNSHVTNYLNHC